MKNAVVLLVALLWVCTALSAQEEKVLTPLSTATTRAVVVGISDYQDPAIPDLLFAHKDAEAFAAWLSRNLEAAGDSLDPDQIRLLLNEQATLGNLYKELEWLVDNSREGDRAIIYFSGHGDIETRTRRKEGFLLCYNSPPNNYRTNAFAVYWLQDIIERLSLDKKARVLVVTDACRAGKLAGQEVNGAQLTTAALQEQFNNEIKILSCQPNEFSLEGEQWGGGHGAFSYHLLDALYGLADQDEDDRVTVKELGRYLEDHVSAETAPHRQNPLVLGDREMRLASVVPEALAQWRQQKAGDALALKKIDPRGFEDLMLAGADSSIRALYAAFTAALERGDLMPTDSSVGNSADDYYRQLIQESSIVTLHGLMTRNFVAALLDESQQLLTGLLNTDPIIIAFLSNAAYDYLPVYLRRAASLLDEKHYLYDAIKAREHYFISRLFKAKNYPELPVDIRIKQALAHLDSALIFDSEAPFIYLEKGYLIFYSGNWTMDAMPWFEKATELAPKWAMAAYYRGLASQRLVRLEGRRFREEAIRWYKKAISLDSTYLPAYRTLGEINKGYEEADYWYQICANKLNDYIREHPGRVPANYYNTLGVAYQRLGRPEEALKEFLKGAPGNDLLVISAYSDLGQYEKAEQMFCKLIGPDSSLNLYLYSYLARLRYFFLNRSAEAVIPVYRNVIAGEPLSYNCYEDLVNVFIENNELDSAEAVVDRWLAQYNQQSWLIMKYKGLISLRKGQSDKARACFEYLSGWVDSLEYDRALRAHLRVISDFQLGKTDRLQLFLREIQQQQDSYAELYFLIATAFAYNNQNQEALNWMEAAFKNGYRSKDVINLGRSLFDPDLRFLRKTPEFNALVKKYFPKKM